MVRKFKGGIGETSGAVSASQVVEFTSKSSVSATNDKIPGHVWDMLQASGEQAASRLLELLSSNKFNALRGSEQANLIKLAFEYAYGKPDAPLKRTISATLAGSLSDEVSNALSDMARSATLPEYINSKRSETPQNGPSDGLKQNSAPSTPDET